MEKKYNTTPPPGKKTWKHLTEKQMLVQALIRGGDYTANEIARIAGVHPCTVTRHRARLRKIAEDTRLHNIARKSLEALAKGKPVGEVKEVKDSTVVAACQVILDRTEPKVQRVESRSMAVNITDETLRELIRIHQEIQGFQGTGVLPEPEPALPDEGGEKQENQ